MARLPPPVMQENLSFLMSPLLQLLLFTNVLKSGGLSVVPMGVRASTTTFPSTCQGFLESGFDEAVLWLLIDHWKYILPDDCSLSSSVSMLWCMEENTLSSMFVLKVS